MESEVAGEVLDVVNDRYFKTGSPGVTDVIRNLGVQVPPRSPEQWEYAWRPPVGLPILTIWAEDVRPHPSGWFYVDSLDTVHRRGGGLRTPRQQERAARRVAILQEMRTSDEDCIGLLQTNRVSIAELEQNQNASVSKRVKDDERWHIASWDEERQRVILVRGKRGWVPRPEDIDGFSAAAGEGAPSSPEDAPHLVFPDKEHRDRVEAAAVARVRYHYESRGYLVEDVSSRNLGYDLEVLDPSGRPVLHVEVKGTSLATEAFFITANEMARATALDTWRLAIVTSALSPEPQLRAPLTAQEMRARFRLDPLVWRATLGAQAGI